MEDGVPGPSFWVAVLWAFLGEGAVSNGAAPTPSEGAVEISLGAAVFVDFFWDGVAEFSLGATVFEDFLGDGEISSGTAVTPSGGVSLGAVVLGAFLGEVGL